MSTISKLKDQVLALVQRSLNVTDTFQGEADSAAVDTLLDSVILQAANNARLWAEREHDFAENDVSVRATVGGSLVTLTGMTDFHGGPNRDLKTVAQVYQIEDKGHRPIRCVSRKHLARMAQKRLDLESPDPYIRYPDDDQSDEGTQYPYAVWHGETLEIIPTYAGDIRIDGQRWMDEYTDDADTDFLLKHGFDFMQWQTILEVNHLTNTFVERQEGSLAPPEKMRDMAWGALVKWDEYRYDGNVQHDL